MNIKQEITNFRRDMWRDQILSNAEEIDMWFAVRESLREAGLGASDHYEIVSAQIDRLESRQTALRTKLRETA